MGRERGIREPIVHASMFTLNPDFTESFQNVLRLFASSGEAYTPSSVFLGEAHGFRTIPFSLDKLGDLFEMWKKERPRRALMGFANESPAGLLLSIEDHGSQYKKVDVSVEREFLANGDTIGKFLTILKELYALLHSMYGEASILEMVRRTQRAYASPLDLRRGIPDLYWANFLGPEYVEMIGLEKLVSAPFCSVETLRDGGVLLLLSPSPLDYLGDPLSFDTRRERIKLHLGPKIFDACLDERRAEVPKFRYEDE